MNACFINIKHSLTGIRSAKEKNARSDLLKTKCLSFVSPSTHACILKLEVSLAKPTMIVGNLLITIALFPVFDIYYYYK